MKYELRFAKDDQTEDIFSNSLEACLIGGDTIFYNPNTRTVHFAREFKALYLCNPKRECKKEIIHNCTVDQFVEVLRLISALTGYEVEEATGEYRRKDLLVYRITKQPTVR